MEIIIVGGGISGLYLAHLLSEKTSSKTKHKIVLYEKENRFGGRIKTVYSEEKNTVRSDIPGKKKEVLYESGPWRIHHSHKRVQRLFSKLGATFKSIDKKKKLFLFCKIIFHFHVFSFLCSNK